MSQEKQFKSAALQIKKNKLNQRLLKGVKVSLNFTFQPFIILRLYTRE